jgi:methionine-rich copper-binding protein CopC
MGPMSAAISWPFSVTAARLHVTMRRLMFASAALAALEGAVARTAAAAPVRPRGVLHASLLSSEPAAGATLVVAPSRVRLVFSEPIEASLSGMTLSSANGDSVPLDPNGDPHDVHAVIASLPALVAGMYTVHWHVVSADGHRVDGSLAFTIESGTATGAGAASGAGTVAPDSVAHVGKSSAIVMTDSGFVAALGPRPIVAELRAAAITALLAFAGLTLLIATLPIS